AVARAEEGDPHRSPLSARAAPVPGAGQSWAWRLLHSTSSILHCLHGWTDPYSRRRGRSGGTQCDQDGPRGRGLRGRRERGRGGCAGEAPGQPAAVPDPTRLMMPGMNGWQFMDEVRVHPGLRQVPIVVVSAYGSADGVRSVGATDSEEALRPRNVARRGEPSRVGGAIVMCLIGLAFLIRRISF